MPYLPFRFPALLFVFCTAASSPAAGQTSSVAVTVFIAVPSLRTATEPLAGLELTITPLAGGSSMLVRTDSTGKAFAHLAPGRYRIRSLNSIRMGGIDHSWDVEANVLATHRALSVSLNRQNADASASTADIAPDATVINPQRTQPQPLPVSVRAPGPLRSGDPGFKDPTTAVLFGLLLTGGGHFYAGETTAGVLYLLGTGALLGVAIGACNYDTCNEGLASGALLGALGLAIYSIFDASAAAGRTNRKGLQTVSLGPLQIRSNRSGLAFAIPLR
jgi:hypothetical protein